MDVLQAFANRVNAYEQKISLLEREVTDLKLQWKKEAQVQIGTREVLITVSPGVDIVEVLETPAFRQWKETLSKEVQLEVSKIHIEAVDKCGSNILVKLRADCTYASKLKIPGIVFVRGAVVAALVVLKRQDRSFALLLRQPRLPVSDSSFPEIPGGIVEGAEQFPDAVVRILKEQTGMRVSTGELIDMTGHANNEYPGVYPTSGGVYEINRLFLYRKVVTAEECAKIDGARIIGDETGMEYAIQLVPLEQLWRCSPDAKALVAFYLHSKLIADKVIPEYF